MRKLKTHCKNGHEYTLENNSCNVGLGMFKENINTLASAIIYLAENG